MINKNHSKEEKRENRLLKGEIVVSLLVVVVIIFVLAISCFSKKYTVTFDSMGGNQITSQKVKAHKKSLEPLNPEKDGYVFEGWYYDGKLFDFSTNITSDIRLEAHWKKIGNEIKVTSVHLNIPSVELYVGEKLALKATVLPENATDKSVVWSSSDDSIVSVDTKGNIEAKQDGSAIITVMTNDGAFMDLCEVDVYSSIGVSKGGN